MSDPIPAFDMGAFLQGMDYLRITNYLTVIALVSWLWDILITLDEEVTLVWKRKGNLVKTLYFLVGRFSKVIYSFVNHFPLESIFSSVYSRLEHAKCVDVSLDLSTSLPHPLLSLADA